MEVLIQKPMAEASDPHWCAHCECKLQRVYTVPSIHMNEWIGEGWKRTNEPPDDLKPDTYHWDTEKHMTSYPDKTVRRKGMKN